MPLIEDKIRKNKDQFNIYEPQKDHFDRFQEKLSELHPAGKSGNYRLMVAWRIAAVLVVLIALSIIISLIPRSGNDVVAANQLPDELVEARKYYSFLTEEKLGRIDECARTDEEAAKLREIALKEMEEIDEQTKMLEEEYHKNAENEKIESALINNYKTKTELLDNMLNRLCRL